MESLLPRYESLPMCLLAAVWSAEGNSRAREKATEETIQTLLQRYRDYVIVPEMIDVSGFVVAFERQGVERFATLILQNRQRTAAENGILNIEAVYKMALLLRERGIETPKDILPYEADTTLREAICAIPGLNQNVLNRLFVLCGTPVAEPGISDKETTHPPLPANESQSVKVTGKELDMPEPRPIITPAPMVEPSVERKPAKSQPVQRYSPRIQDIPTDERPRERLIQHGPYALNTAELLAILLRTGSEQRSAVNLAEHLLSQFGGLRGVARMTIEELSAIHGIGTAKATQIKAAIEFGRRLVASSPEERPKIGNPNDVYNLVGPMLREERREHVIALLLDTKGGVMRQKTVSIGDLSSSIVGPREVFAEAVRHGAASLILVHNHPSGDPTPSSEDVAVTKRLKAAGELLGIELLDHIVLGDKRWTSLREKGLM